MTERELMSIKRDLQARARRMGLGKARTGAYVFGTLRRIRRNPATPQVDPPWNYGIYTGGKSVAQRMRRQAEILEEDERLVPSTLTYEDIKDDPKLIAHYKKIMTPMAWRQLVDDYIKRGWKQRDFVCPTPAEYKRLISENPRSAQRDVWLLSTKAEVKKLIERKLRKGFMVQSVVEVDNGMYRVVVVKPRPSERIVWGESAEDYARRAFPKIMQNPSENTLFMSLTDRGGKKKTWHIGESAVGGIIAAKVSQNGTAVAIRNATYHGNETLSVRLFRWPLDKFSMMVYLNELTTSYYADKIMDWIRDAAKG